MKLITEEIQDAEFITEESKPGVKSHYVKGIFLQSNVKNRNGRYYPKELLEREVSRYNKNYVAENRAMGEMGHPQGPGINLDRVSHKIVELYPDGNNYIGKAKILDTPYGKIVKNLMDEGVKLGVSSRGVGTLREANGYQLVNDDYMLATAADIVADPSAPDAFVSGIMEGREWIMESGIWKEQDLIKAKTDLAEASRHDFEDLALRAFAKFMSGAVKI